MAYNVNKKGFLVSLHEVCNGDTVYLDVLPWRQKVFFFLDAQASLAPT